MTTAQSNNVTHFCNPLNFVTQNAFAIAASNNWKIATMYHNKEYTRVTMFTPFYFVHPTTKQRMEALLKQFSTVVGISGQTLIIMDPCYMDAKEMANNGTGALRVGNPLPGVWMYQMDNDVNHVSGVTLYHEDWYAVADLAGSVGVDQTSDNVGYGVVREGLVTLTGYGDGEYPVRVAKKIIDGVEWVIGVEMTFIVNYDDDFYSNDDRYDLQDADWDDSVDDK